MMVRERESCQCRLAELATEMEFLYHIPRVFVVLYTVFLIRRR
jgi:hypothetical protein